MSEPIKFLPLYSDAFRPEVEYGHIMHYGEWTLKEVVERGLFDLFLSYEGTVGWDIETNGLDASREDFRWSGMGLSIKGKNDTILDGGRTIHSHPLGSNLDWREYSAVWIEFRGYEEYIPQAAEFLIEADRLKKMMAHNSAYEFKCANRNLGIQLWNLQDSRAYLAAGFFGRMALKMNAKSLVNAHEWEDACTTHRKKSQLPTRHETDVDDLGKAIIVPGLTEEQSWAKCPTHLLGPYCAWDCVYTLSMCEEIIRRSEIVRNSEGMNYPKFLPIWQTQEVYRRQIILSGLIDDRGVPTTKEAFERFLSWGVKHEIQHKTWFAKRLGLPYDEAYLSSEIGIDPAIVWPDTLDELMELKKVIDGVVSLDKRDKAMNYGLWHQLVFTDTVGIKTFRSLVDKEHESNNWRDSMVSSWRNWAAQGELVTSMRKDTSTLMYQASGCDLLNDPSDIGIALAKFRWTKQVGKMVGDALAYEKRDELPNGKTTPVHKGRVETENSRLGFSWNPVSKETRRWASGFHIVSPNARVHDIFKPKPGRIQVHADLSGAEIQMSSAQAGDVATLEAFIDGLDLHLRNAANSFRIPEADVTKEQRNIAKLITFRLLFGSTVEGIAQALGIDMEDAMKIVHAFFSANPQLKKFLDTGMRFAVDHECRVSIFGDLLGLPKDALTTKYHNIIVQHSSSNSFGLGLFDLQRSMVLNDLDAWLFGFVHDSTDIDTPIANMFKVISLMRKTIVDSQLTNYGVPARLDYEICANGGKFHASHFSGEGSQSNPWEMTLAPGLIEDMDCLMVLLRSTFHVEVVETKEDDNVKGWNSVQDVIMAPLEYKTFPSFENERRYPKIGHTLRLWTEDESRRVDLSHVESPMDKSLINCEWPKRVAPMYNGAP